MSLAGKGLCGRCGVGGLHGFRRDGGAATVWFWCPARRSHDPHVTACAEFERGRPGMFYRDGERMEGR